MSKMKRSLPLVMLCLGLMIGLSVGVGMMFGTLATVGYWQQASSQAEPPQLWETQLHALGAHGGDKLAMSTGPIDEDTEGLFVLDFLTGDIYCWVVNPRNLLGSMFIGQFKHNVVADLGLDKGKAADYVLVTGTINAIRGGAAERPANCICYVGDANTGNVVAYTIAWNKTAANASVPQAGPFIKVAVGKARPDIERD